MSRRFYLINTLIIAVLLGMTGCSQATPQQGSATVTPVSDKFDPENQKEYGMQGVYLGEGIKEAIDQLKPTQYDFMDAVSRQSMTVEQLAKGEGTISTGVVTLGKIQIIMKVQNGVIDSLMTGGIPESEGKNLKTNRGVALYDTADKVKAAYGEAQGDKELVYKGSKYQMLYTIFNGKIIGYRFDKVQ